MKNKHMNKLEDLLIKLNPSNEDREDIENILRLIEKEMSKKRYGLVYEEQLEDIVEETKNKNIILKERNDLSIVNIPNKESNILIEGDNYLALKKLQKTHKEKIDVIYIDPPYFTGNEDFVYNDNFVNKEDSWRHSKWLSFMEKRLRLARELMSNEGVIFISIDDNELYQLKLLCDSIFGENNFIANIVLETANGVFGTRASMIEKTFVKVKDYILVYRKNNIINKTFMPLYTESSELFDSHFSTVITEKGEKFTLIEFLNNNEDIKKIFESYNLSISYNNINKIMKINKEFYKYINEEISNIIYQDTPYNLKINEEDEKKLRQGEIVRIGDCLVFKTNKGKGNNRQYIPLYKSVKVPDDYKSTEKSRAIAVGDLWKGYYKDMGNVTKEGDVEFRNGKKPIRLIKNILKWYNKKDAIVLDFFAGSGTTGHAVMELNKEDGGNRQFILCTNNEVSKEKNMEYLLENKLITDKSELNEFKKSDMFKEVIEREDYKELGICRSVTFERLKKVIKGYKDKEGLKDNNLNYYEIFSYEEILDIDNLINDIKLKHSLSLPLSNDESLEIYENSKEKIFIYKSKYFIEECYIYNIENYFDLEKRNILYISSNVKEDMLLKNLLKKFKIEILILE